MGHLHLYRLPDSQAWQLVRELLEQGIPVARLAEAILNASQAGFKRALNDDTLNYSFWLLTQITMASRSQDFPKELQRLGLLVSSSPSLMEISAGFTEAVDTYTSLLKDTSDLGEMAQMAAVETMSKMIGSELSNIFSASFTEAHSAFRKYSSPDQFSNLAHEFFNRFTYRYIDYFLSRTISFYVGPTKTLKSYDEHQEFQLAFQTHCRESSFVIQQFAAPWYSKLVSNGGINLTTSKDFVSSALQQIRDELKVRGQAHGE